MPTRKRARPVGSASSTSPEVSPLKQPIKLKKSGSAARLRPALREYRDPIVHTDSEVETDIEVQPAFSDDNWDSDGVDAALAASPIRTPRSSRKAKSKAVDPREYGFAGPSAEKSLQRRIPRKEPHKFLSLSRAGKRVRRCA